MRVPMLAFVRRLIAGLLIAVWLATPLSAQLVDVTASVSATKISTLGKYSGYSAAAYDGWQRNSIYVPVRDGTRLAIDIFRPTRAGQTTDERMPVVWTHHRYQRSGVEFGQQYTVLDAMPWLQDVLRHGYVVAAVDARGSGASFGRFEGMYAPSETHDAYDVTEWLAAQPWSNGAIGMYGISYLASTQYMAASQMPPHLKAIFPEKGVADQYALLYSGGLYRGPFIENWTDIVRVLDVDAPAMPVDADELGTLLAAAVAEHRSNRDASLLYSTLPWRDSVDPISGALPWRDWTPITALPQIRRSKVAIYHLAGWYDRYVRDQIVLYRNLDNAQKLTIGPWSHVQNRGLDQAAEHLRWWDYWLKNIQNGVMDEPSVHYYMTGASANHAWRTSATWPPEDAHPTSFYLAEGRSGSVPSVNDGGLSEHDPGAASASDAYTVDLSTAVEPDPRWSLQAEFPELSQNDAKALTYTSAPLRTALEIAGHPIVHLWISASESEAAVFAYLEDVDEDGHSHYVSEGSLRASNRAISEPDYDFVGLPYHRGNRADRVPLTPGASVELRFDLFPIAHRFETNHRIRLAITGADKANARTSERTPQLRVYRDKDRASRVELPVMAMMQNE